MKLTADRPFADPAKAARKLVEIANAVEALALYERRAVPPPRDDFYVMLVLLPFRHAVAIGVAAVSAAPAAASLVRFAAVTAATSIRTCLTARCLRRTFAYLLVVLLRQNPSFNSI
jgi:hypothetical protein